MRNIERAIYSARLMDDGSLGNSPDSEKRRKRQYVRIIDKLDSVKTRDLLLKLEEGPFKFTQDSEIEAYFNGFNIPIRSKKDLDFFYEIISEELPMKEMKERKDKRTEGLKFLGMSIFEAGLSCALYYLGKDIDMGVVKGICYTFSGLEAVCAITATIVGVDSLIKARKRKEIK